MTTSDLRFIETIRSQGKHAEDNLALCDVLHLIKLVADGDLRHINDEDFRKECAKSDRHFDLLKSAAEEMLDYKPVIIHDHEGDGWMEAEIFEALQVDFEAALEGKTWVEMEAEKTA